MLDDKRKVLGGIFIISLFCSVIIFHILDNGMLCSVKLMSEKELMQMCSDKIFVEYAVNIDNLLLFNGHPIPYDEETNCFYICQNIENEEYSGTINTVSEDVDVWIVKDDYTHKLKDAVRQGHTFSVWVAEKDSYAICHIIFTGLPVVELDTEGEIGPEYIFGSIGVWNPNDKETGIISCKESCMLLKCSESLETYTTKLMDQEGVNHRKLSLLNMGKYDAWKLYAVSEKDTTYLRSMLSYLLWNSINTAEKFNRPCQYAEVIVNNEYKGLFVVAPRIDDDFLELGETGRVISMKSPGNGAGMSGEYSEDDTVYSAKEAYGVETLQLDNLAEYFLFLELTYAYQNVLDNFYVIWDSTDQQSFLMPGKIEYSFGIFPDRLQYMTWQMQDRVLTPQLLEFEGVFSDEGIRQRMVQRWKALRSGELSNEKLLRLIDELQIYLSESGYVARCGAAKGNPDSHAAGMGELINYLTVRMEVLDRYYGTGES